MYRIAAGFIAAMLWLAVPAVVMAHTGIAVSSPSDGDTFEGELKQVDMTFTTTFEKALSTATLTNEAGEEIPYAELVQENKSMSMRFEEPLAGGAYTVNWKLLGADGHAVEGKYGFTVKLGEPAGQEQPAAEGGIDSPPAAGESGDGVAEEAAPAGQPDADASNGAPPADAGAGAEQTAQSPAPAASASMLGSGGMIAVLAGIAALGLLLIRSLRKQ